MKYIIANSNPIHSKIIERNFNDGNYVLIENKVDLSVENISQLNPEFIFFPHWSYIIPEEIWNNYNCVVFHMTDLPFGRGGSPLQNLIEREISETNISALKVVKEIDAGPIYMKKPFSLYGTAEEIFIRTGKVIVSMIKEIVKTSPSPTEQAGDIVLFKRRKPEMSDISKLDSLEKIFDYIRMLDGKGYPKAYIETDEFKFEFSRASFKSDETILADVRIFKK